MKRKRTKGLSCERAQAFPIERALAKLGHFPTTSTGKEAWYLSPFRPEVQASFKVSKMLNRWYDHGAGKGGNVIDLVCQLNECPVSEALRLIAQEQTSFSFHRRPVFEKEEGNEHKIAVTEIGPITHPALIGYLKSRNIDIRRASKYCKEVHYKFRDKSYFAIGLKNDSGGWELRNKYMKNSSSPKDITHIKNGNIKLIVTEGMFDLLSILESYEKLESEHDFLVLNSTAFVQKAMRIIDGYSGIELYLDNDRNGKQTTHKLIRHSKDCKDRSTLYKDFKDMNERLMGSTEELIGQGIQDVFLLPQKRSCFSPDGRKVKRK
ncbi:toprim domain-containing protein [Pricia sp. S334]|uniref:Toprim domain-containing protein n=1 Tax=Pricia mediterranea TaxID=3076079 RepID=A0ABU3L716_9FLAO|nr:toprim domain-containing protein [Pricia sp. S334]MDT7828852.1 toprim domain-containing protein [Pricia sp. S334]